jgi:alkyldihydroxyacetonephosphate synthase
MTAPFVDIELPERAPVADSVKREARRIVGERWFHDSLPDRMAWGRDCWPLGILWTRGGQVTVHLPDFIAIPGSLDEVVALVRLARESGAPIVPYGAGSGVCGGALGLSGGFTLDLKRFDHHTLDAERWTVRAGAGAIGMHLETDLLRAGFTLGHYPSSLYCSSLGGYLAARSAGQLSSRYGKIEDMCLSLQAVAGTGEVLESARCRPDPTQLLIGSEGTLGILTEATLRVEPAPAERVYRGFQFHSVDAALGAIRELIQAGFQPAVVRLYDEFDTLIAKRGGRHDVSPEGAGTDGLMAQLRRHAYERAVRPVQATVRRAAEGLLKRVLGAPLWLNRAVSVLPSGVMLIVGFEGEEGLTAARAAAAFERLAVAGDDLGEGPGQHWFEHRFSVSYKQSPMMDLGAFVDTMEVSTTWDNLADLYRAVRVAVSPHAFIMAHFSHVYPPGSSIYSTFAGFAPDGEPIQELYQRTWRAASGAVMRSGSSVTHHHGAGLSKGGYLEADHRGGAELYALLKRRLDPSGILNPGKLWDVAQVLTVEPEDAPR